MNIFFLFLIQLVQLEQQNYSGFSSLFFDKKNLLNCYLKNVERILKINILKWTSEINEKVYVVAM